VVGTEKERVEDLSVRIDEFAEIFQMLDEELKSFAKDTNDPLICLRRGTSGKVSGLSTNKFRNEKRYDELAEEYHAKRKINERKKAIQRERQKAKDAAEAAEAIRESNAGAPSPFDQASA